MNLRVYNRNPTKGVDRTRTKTQMITVEEPVEGGSTKLEWRPEGASIAGMRYGSALEAAILSYGKGVERESDMSVKEVVRTIKTTATIVMESCIYYPKTGISENVALNFRGGTIKEGGMNVKTVVI